MKKLVFLLAVIIALSCIPAFASGDPCASGLGSAILNQCVEHPTFVDTDTVFDRSDPMGVGIDFVVYESDTWWAQEVTVEPRWDFANDEGQLFFVTKVNLQKFWAPVLDKSGE